VRKLGVPGNEELARDTVATGGVRVLNEPVVEGRRLPDAVIDEVTTQAQPELTRRERLDRGGRPPADVRGRTIILVDDGLATEATRHAAINALRPQPPARIIVAVPTAAPDPGNALRAEVDEGICAITPAPCQAVGLWAEDCSPTTDDEVRDLLARRAPPEARHATPRTTDTRLSTHGRPSGLRPPPGPGRQRRGAVAGHAAHPLPAHLACG
jgi:predicted phosphoribosyltransferase